MLTAFIHRFFTEDRIVSLVIVLNAIVLFLLSFDEIHQDYPNLERTLTIIDTFFIFYFVMEALLKIRQLGWETYISNSWNRFDFTIVLLSIPSILLIFEFANNELSFVFVLRIVRVLRFFKFLKFIPNIDELAAGVGRAFRASILVLFGFFIYTFVIALISCRLFKEKSPEFFGDPITSFYSIFKIFTIEGWYEIPDSIAKEDPMFNFFTIVYFIIVVVSGGLFGLSIVNAIFVEEMVRDNNDDLKEKVHDLDRKLDQILARMEEEKAWKVAKESRESESVGENV